MAVRTARGAGSGPGDCPAPIMASIRNPLRWEILTILGGGKVAIAVPFDPLWPAHVGHAPDVLVLTEAADQAVAVCSQPVDRRLNVVDFE